MLTWQRCVVDLTLTLAHVEGQKIANSSVARSRSQFTRTSTFCEYFCRGENMEIHLLAIVTESLAKKPSKPPSKMQTKTQKKNV